MTSKQAKQFLSDMGDFWQGMCRESDDLAEACYRVSELDQELNQSQISKVENISEEYFPFDEFDLQDLLDILDDIEYFDAA